MKKILLILLICLATIVNGAPNPFREVVYLKETNTEGIVIRKSKGTYKISKDVKTIRIGNYDVIEQTKGENITLATWTDGTYSYVINPNGTELNAEEMAKLILNIK